MFTGVVALVVAGIYQEHYDMSVQLTGSRRRENSSLFLKNDHITSDLLNKVINHYLACITTRDFSSKYSESLAVYTGTLICTVLIVMTTNLPPHVQME